MLKSSMLYATILRFYKRHRMWPEYVFLKTRSSISKDVSVVQYTETELKWFE